LSVFFGNLPTVRLGGASFFSSSSSSSKLKTGIVTFFALCCTTGFFFASSSSESCWPKRSAALIFAFATGFAFSCGLGVLSLISNLVVSFLRRLAAYCYDVTFEPPAFVGSAGAGLFTGGVIELPGTLGVALWPFATSFSGSISVLVVCLASMG